MPYVVRRNDGKYIAGKHRYTWITDIQDARMLRKKNQVKMIAVWKEETCSVIKVHVTPYCPDCGELMWEIDADFLCQCGVSMSK